MARPPSVDAFSIDLAGEADLLPMTALPLRRGTKRGQRMNLCLHPAGQSRVGPACGVYDRPLTVEDPRPMVACVRPETINQELT
jgi:hypothetical protein